MHFFILDFQLETRKFGVGVNDLKGNGDKDITKRRHSMLGSDAAPFFVIYC